MRRSTELDARIRDLHRRNAELSSRPGPPDLEDRRTNSSTPTQVAKAEAAARIAAVRAAEAVQRTALLRLHAARAHDRAAQLHDMLADTDRGDVDVQAHRDRAATHRRQAREDRAAADRIFRSPQVRLPQSGQG